MEIHLHEILISTLNTASWVQVLQFISGSQMTFSKFFLNLFILSLLLGHQNIRCVKAFFFQPKMHEKVQSLESMALSNMQTIKK